MAVKIESKVPMFLGIGVLGIGIFLLTRKKKPTLLEPPPNSVVVGLLNPPSDAENWSLSLTDWDITVPIRFIGRNDQQRVDIAAALTFEIPSGLNFPLRILALQITKWNEARTALIVLYEVQSFRPFLWDWDKWEWSDEPDPDYREVFIPDFGSYYYNVSKERFE